MVIENRDLVPTAHMYTTRLGMDEHKEILTHPEASLEIFFSWTHPHEIIATMARKFVSFLWMAFAVLQLSPAASYRVPRDQKPATYTNRTSLSLYFAIHPSQRLLSNRAFFANPFRRISSHWWRHSWTATLLTRGSSSSTTPTT